MQKESHSRRNFKKFRIKLSFSEARNFIWKFISGVEIFISILNGVLKIEEVLEFAKFMDSSGILLALDFDKEFNSLNHSFLLKVL